MSKIQKATKPQEVQATIKEFTREFLGEVLEAELEEFLGYKKYERSDSDNYRNGYTPKSVKTTCGPIELLVPRDRKGEFEPQLIRKRQTMLDEIENQITALYAKGMSTRDIQEILSDMYGFDVSPSLISNITDRILPKIKEWQARPLKEKYFLLWIDCIFYNIREDGQVRKKAIYVVISIDLEGYKEILGFWIDGTESSRFWLGVLNDLKARGVRDVFIFSVDGLTGLDKAIEATFPKADIQRCVVHQIRNSLRYVSWKDKRELARDLKKVYGAPTLEVAEREFEDFSAKWGEKYPHVVKSWEANWEALTTFLRYPVEIRRVMYTTNIIESVNSKFRKATAGRRVFPTEESLLKCLYMAAMELERKWRRPIKDWPSIYAQLSILFEDRL
ncbi:IS256 family transposase [Thermosulfurimonas dismutans]|uniref:Mutator family transposase n=3 Tax=Thermosulfurimonas dismutans TaxID=999894 RepID=A0A179D4E4_9BACT|nr:IS256 family transposase [Thermosulfurimonas dismutans]OAQ20906.1 Mobile element protein [Thermosulfurimonas dismutans]